MKLVLNYRAEEYAEVEDADDHYRFKGSALRTGHGWELTLTFPTAEEARAAAERALS